MSVEGLEPSGDLVVRAISDDGAFRVIAARTTRTVADAVKAQGARDANAKRFGELLTAAVLVREAMAPSLRVQAIVKADGGSLVADSHPGGATRGLVQVPSGATPAFARHGSLLQVMRTMPNGSLHQGVVEVPQQGGIPAGIMTYMQESEQVYSVVAIATLIDDAGAPAASGGYMVQLLPEVERGSLMIMTERLADFASIDDLLRSEHGSPEGLLEELLHGMPYTQLDAGPLEFSCACSEMRLLASLATLPRADVDELVAAGKVLEIRCDYCGREYAIAPEKLRALLASS